MALLALQGCGLFTPPPKSAAELLASGDLRGALEAAQRYDADAATRDRVVRAVVAAVEPKVTVAAVPQDEMIQMAGVHTVRNVDPAWAFVRVRASAQTLELGEVEAAAEITSGDKGLFVLGHDAKSVSLLTGEAYPPDIVHSTLKTGDFPWPAHVLTAGVLTLLTLRVERTYEPPPIEKVRAAVPRALRLSAALESPCSPPSRCGRLLVLRRPLRDDEPLSLWMSVTIGPGHGSPVSVAATVDVPPGGRLEERLARAATGLRIAALNDASIRLGTQPPPRRPCDKDYLLGFRQSPCVESAKWPTGEITPIGLDPPPAPEKLGTPAESLAARPWWHDDGYAPEVSPSQLDAALPVPDSVEGGLLHCKQTALRVPFEDTDRVYAHVKVDGRTWTVDGDDFTLPLLSLGPKSKIPISFYDGDWISGADHLVTMTLSRQGNTMSASVGSLANYNSAWAEVKCQLFARDAVEAAFTKRWQRAMDALDACDEVPIVVRPDERDLGMPGSRLPHARSLVAETAGLVGWSDPRVARLVSRWESLEARFWSGVRKSIEGLPSGPSGTVVLDRPKPPKAKVHGATRRCGEAVKREIERSKRISAKEYDSAYLSQVCAVDVDVENLDQRKLSVRDLISSQIVLDDGRAIDVDYVAGHELSPGERGVLSFVPKATPPPRSRAPSPWRFVVRGSRWIEIVPIR